MNTSRLLLVEDRSQVAEARRLVQQAAEGLSFDERDAGKISIVVTELATNILKHAGRGQLILQIEQNPSSTVINMLALDRGPGMKNVSEAMRDGHSTSGSSGTGLGAIARLSPVFDIHTIPNGGTAVLAGFASRPAKKEEIPFKFGGVSVPKNGEKISGDAWTACFHSGMLTILVVDGLGHGPLAADAARLAVEEFERHNEESPEDILSNIHRALLTTRGAAAAVARLHQEKEVMQFCGVGNISGVIQSGTKRQSLVSFNGIVGHEVQKMKTFEYSFPENGLLILHSDGVSTHWDLSAYPGIQMRNPLLAAGIFIRDFSKGRDDATAVFVARNKLTS